MSERGKKVQKESRSSRGSKPQKYTDKDKQMQKRKSDRDIAGVEPAKRRRSTPDNGVGHASDVDKLSATAPCGSKPKAGPSQGRPTFVMFDLETTGFIQGRRMPHITQIAAMEPRSGLQFNCYVIPEVPIEDKVAEITGIELSASGSMFVKGKPVEAHNITTAMDKFMKWLERFPRVILIAHYGKLFDFPVLFSAATSIHVHNRLTECVMGLIDSHPMFKEAFPNMNSYKQEDLVNNLLHSAYNAHSAIADVKALGRLVKHADLSCDNMVEYSFKPNEVLNQFGF